MGKRTDLKLQWRGYTITTQFPRKKVRVPFDQNFRKFRFKIEWNRNFPEIRFENFGSPLEVVLFLEILKFRKFPVPFGISTRYESAPIPLVVKSPRLRRVSHTTLDAK